MIAGTLDRQSAFAVKTHRNSLAWYRYKDNHAGVSFVLFLTTHHLQLASVPDSICLSCSRSYSLKRRRKKTVWQSEVQRHCAIR